MTTSKPNSLSCLAAIRPAIPAPITITLPWVMSLEKKIWQEKYLPQKGKSSHLKLVKSAWIFQSLSTHIVPSTCKLSVSIFFQLKAKFIKNNLRKPPYENFKRKLFAGPNTPLFRAVAESIFRETYIWPRLDRTCAAHPQWQAEPSGCPATFATKIQVQ